MNNIFEVLIGNDKIVPTENRFFIVNSITREILFESRDEQEANETCNLWNTVGVTWRNDGTLELP